MLIINKNDKNSLDVACDFLEEGKIISFATETVYGLACDANNKIAIDSIYKLKKRVPDKPLAIFFNNINHAKKYVKFNRLADKISQKYLPGPLTIILPKKNLANFKFVSNFECDNLAFRISDDDFAHNLTKKFKSILAVTSANISGSKAANHHDDVKKIFANLPLDLLICGGYCGSKIPSTIIKINDNNFELIRKGQLTIKI